jgi:hypothetical protein
MLICTWSARPLSQQFPSRKTPPPLPNFHSERLSIRCVRPGRRKLFCLVVFLQFCLASAELPARAALQIPDGWSQSKLLATICLWISRGGHFSMESSADKTPMEPVVRSGVYSGVRRLSWLPCRVRLARRVALFLLANRMPLEVIYFCSVKNNEYYLSTLNCLS